MCEVVLNRFELFAAAQPLLFTKGMQAISLRINAFLGLEPLSFAFAPEKNIKIKFQMSRIRVLFEFEIGI